METGFFSTLFSEEILPFLLVFVVIFAILEKTKVLGDGKKQIDAITAAIVGLILVLFPYPRDIIIKLMPLLAVVAIVMLIFMMLYSFAALDKDGKFEMPKGLKTTFGILIGIVLVVALFAFTGYWDVILNLFNSGKNELVMNIIFAIVVIVAVVAVITMNGKKSEKSE